MYPFFVDLPFGQSVTVQQVMLAVAMFFGLTIGPVWVAWLEGLPLRRVLLALTLISTAGLIGGHVHFVINTWSTLYANQPLTALKFWSGQHAAGAVLGLTGATILVSRWLRIPIGKLADGLVPTAGVSLALVRIGCFLRGCCHGVPCSWPWAVTFPRGTYVFEQHESLGLIVPHATHSAPVHPLQLYFVLAALSVTAVALWYRRYRRFDGEIALIALLQFSITTTVLEFFRGDFPERAYWGALPQLTWAAMGLLVAATLVLAAVELRFARRVR